MKHIHLYYDHDMDEYGWQYWADPTSSEPAEGGSSKVLTVSDAQYSALKAALERLQSAQREYGKLLDYILPAR